MVLPKLALRLALGGNESEKSLERNNEGRMDSVTSSIDLLYEDSGHR